MKYQLYNVHALCMLISNYKVWKFIVSRAIEIVKELQNADDDDNGGGGDDIVVVQLVNISQCTIVAMLLADGHMR